MCSCGLSWVKFQKMASIPKILFVTFLFFITVAEGGHKRSKDKIIIHVPYKILKHHHTHTKYKVITIPTPKKENTIIYLKEEIQPTIKYIPQVQTHTEVTEIQQKPSQSFIPPHQASAAALLEDLAKHKEQSSVQTDQQQEYSNIKHNLKSPKSQSEENSEEFVPSFTYKPMMPASQENVVPNISFRPVILPKQSTFMPKLLINHPIIHPSYAAYFHKFLYPSMLHLSHGQFNPKYMFKQKLPQKVLEDNVAHASDQIYKTMLNPRLKTTSYKVKEESDEDHNMQSMKNQHTTLNPVPVPSLKYSRKGKSHLRPDHSHQFKNLIPSHPDYEYEHVGYLIIDGKSKKIVGKNFKDQIHLSR